MGKGGLLATALMLGTLTACKTQQVNTLSRSEKKQGWQLLFNGRNLDGWHSYHQKGVGQGWRVEDGAIRLEAEKGGADLVTDQEFENYELSLQWKISEEGNSGIIFNVHEDPNYPNTYMSGPEMQVLDNVKASDNKKDNHLAGSLYDLIAADPSTVHPAGEWNTVKIRMDHGHLTFWMNGHKVVETQMWDDAWKKLVAGSKFRRWKTFAAFHQGHIALQYHGHDVWYRDIMIRTL